MCISTKGDGCASSIFDLSIASASEIYVGGVKAIGFTEFMRDHPNITYMAIDIEGAEVQIADQLCDYINGNPGTVAYVAPLYHTVKWVKKIKKMAALLSLSPPIKTWGRRLMRRP